VSAKTGAGMDDFLRLLLARRAELRPA